MSPARGKGRGSRRIYGGLTWQRFAATVVHMKTVSVRLPDNLHDRVKAVAELDRRSLNGEILWLIEQGLDHGQPRGDGS